jgi:hypothetical protein
MLLCLHDVFLVNPMLFPKYSPIVIEKMRNRHKDIRSEMTCTTSREILEIHLNHSGRGSEGCTNSRRYRLLILWCRHRQRYVMNTNYWLPKSDLLRSQGRWMQWWHLPQTSGYVQSRWQRAMCWRSHRIHQSKWLKIARQRYLRFCGLSFHIFSTSPLMWIDSVLKEDGIFIYITFGQPHFRRRYLTGAHVSRETSLEINQLGESFHYYMYTLRMLWFSTLQSWFCEIYQATTLGGTLHGRPNLKSLQVIPSIT